MLQPSSLKSSFQCNQMKPSLFIHEAISLYSQELQLDRNGSYRLLQVGTYVRVALRNQPPLLPESDRLFIELIRS